jgi:hypothetical protein
VSRPPLWQARCLAGAGVVGLTVLALAHLQPAPSIRVRWRDDVSAPRQTELERKYHLADPAATLPEAPRSIAYRLLDTSRANIEALVNDPQVADTNDIDRAHFEPIDYRGVGEQEIAVVRRTLRLRDGRVQFVALLVFALIAAAGARRIGAERRKALRGPARAADADRDTDVFDTLAARFPALRPSGPEDPEGVGSLAKKCLAVMFAVLAMGMPILERWETLLLAGAVFVTIFGATKQGWRRVGVAAAILLLASAVKWTLPRADIAEAHNAFMVMDAGGPLERGLPPAVFRSWKAQFDALYPPAAEPYVPYSWRAHASVPQSLFARSADAVWRTPKYTRQVDDIHVATLAEFRGGFVNDLRYNFWNGELSRNVLPFYVMYELSQASVGSRLAWAGQAFWERADGGFDEVVHPEVTARAIEPDDSGRRVYAAFFPQRDGDRTFRLELAPALQYAGWFMAVLTIVSVVAIIGVIVRCRWVPTLRALTLFGVAYLLVVSAGGASLGRSYPPHRGGDDGLFYESVGRGMALLAGRGEIVKAMEGAEPVYWFTPGTRYFRMFEKLIFGETNLLYGVLIASVPVAVFMLCRQFLSLRTVWPIAGVFLLMPVGNLSFLQYIANGSLGYSEALGCGLFLAGLALLIHTQPAWGGTSRNLWLALAAGGTLAASMIVRPNFALSVAWCGAASAWSSRRRGDGWAIVPLGCGLALALWMPFHNWFYGGEFHLIARTEGLWLALGVGDYAVAARDAITGQTYSPTAIRVSQQLTSWLGGPAFVDRRWLMPLAWAMHALKLLAFAVSLWVAARWMLGRAALRAPVGVMAVAALLAHVPMLFIWETPSRYAMLAWDLCLLVLVVHAGSDALAGAAKDAPHASPAPGCELTHA